MLRVNTDGSVVRLKDDLLYVGTRCRELRDYRAL